MLLILLLKKERTGGIITITFHVKLKGAYKGHLRILVKKYNIPVIKHQLLRGPWDIT
jgi:hypothetical protein